MPQQPRNTGARQEAPSQEEPSMDQVRELLFGSQLKEIERRLQRQEEIWTQEMGTLRESMKSRLDSLENFMKSETASLLHRLQEEQAERDKMLKIEQRERIDSLKSEEHERVECIKNEQRERIEALTKCSRELTSATETFELKITKLTGTLDSVEQELRALLLSETSALAAKMEELHRDALTSLNDVNGHLRQDVVYRSVLSSLFAEAAVKLNNDLTLNTLLGSGSAPADDTHE